MRLSRRLLPKLDCGVLRTAEEIEQEDIDREQGDRMGRYEFIALCFGITLTATATGSHSAAALERPTWAKQATALDLSCSAQAQTIPSPNSRYILQVVCIKHGEDDPTYALRLVSPNKQISESSLDEGAHELLWAPDSSAFFVNGGTSSYAGFFVAVYQIKALAGMRKLVITKAAQTDMVEQFPPCKAYNRDQTTCGRIADHPEYNMSGLGWRDDSAAIYVFAEVPCSSSYGGIMCQVLGYELSIPDGRILARLSALQAKEQWNKYATWDIRIPDSPKYGPAQVIR